MSAHRPSGGSGDSTAVPAVQKPLGRRGPNHALQRTEAGDGVCSVVESVLASLSLSLEALVILRQML